MYLGYMNKLDEMLGYHVPSSDMLATRELLLTRILLEHLLECVDSKRFVELYLPQKTTVAKVFDELKMI